MRTVDHDYLEPGMYVAQKVKPKGLFTKPIYVYDCRFRKPNSNNYLKIKQAHTLEHLIADYMKREYPGKVISWNMFMCLTGGYLETYLPPQEAREALLNTLDIITYKCKKVPFATRKECGNYKAHDLEAALEEVKAYTKILKSQETVLYYQELPQNEVED